MPLTHMYVFVLFWVQKYIGNLLNNISSTGYLCDENPILGQNENRVPLVITQYLKIYKN